MAPGQGEVAIVTHYEPLSSLDSSFLALETRTTHMHVAGLVTFEVGPLRTADGGIDVTKIRRHIASRLHLIPRYRMRLAHVPVERRPVWVDDEHFTIEFHVRHTSLPRPGDDAQLMVLMGRLASQQLDRSKPLWEMWIVEGLSEDRFALISKTHHSMIDGVSGVDIMSVLLNLAPDETVTDAEPYLPRPAPGGAELVLREAVRRTGRVVSAAVGMRELGEDAQALATGSLRKLRAMGHSLGSGWLTMASDTPLNGRVGPNRRFGTLSIDLNGVKAIKNALGGSVNDVVLAVVAGGVRLHLKANHGQDVDDVTFRVMAPVSVRSRHQQGALGNQVAMWLVSLPVSEADPLARLADVREATTRLKQTDQALGAETLVRLSAGAPITLVSLAGRLASNARPFNMTVTNVPGPQFPLYLLGSRMLATFPLVPLWEGHGAGIAIFSYAGKLHWGFNADWDVLSDLDRFIAAIEHAYNELSTAAALAKTASGGAAAAQSPAAVTTPTPEAASGAATPGRPRKRPPLGAKKPAAEPAAADPETEALAATSATSVGGAATSKPTRTAKPATKAKPASRKQPKTPQSSPADG
ncbi:MAG: wax ester/triacylglycerol synthase family O-acyltransferase [Acidimicrobiia bacterium]|nr:wax ester/triacylglycerol synthase family O-acyltransferase [Acidimicrobiia bacterium]